MLEAHPESASVLHFEKSVPVDLVVGQGGKYVGITMVGQGSRPRTLDEGNLGGSG